AAEPRRAARARRAAGAAGRRDRSVSASRLLQDLAEDRAAGFDCFRYRDRHSVDGAVFAEVALVGLGPLAEVQHVEATAVAAAGLEEFLARGRAEPGARHEPECGRSFVQRRLCRWQRLNETLEDPVVEVALLAVGSAAPLTAAAAARDPGWLKHTLHPIWLGI